MLVVVIATAIRRERFLSWAAVFLCAAIGLTLFWGTIQDGDMFYYNAWPNFAIYYFGLLIMVSEFAARRNARPPRWSVVERVAVAAVAAVVCAMFADNWRVRDAAPETTALLHESIGRVLAANPTGDPAFVFPKAEWPVVVAMGLEMTRAGRPFEVPEAWGNVFGREHSESRLSPGRLGMVAPWRFEKGPGAAPWQSNAPELLAPSTRQLREQLAAAPPAVAGTIFALPDDTSLATVLPVIPLPTGSETWEMNFHRGGNAGNFLVDGWSEAEDWGTWSDGHRSLLRFGVSGLAAAGGNVEMALEMHPFVSPPDLTTQRIVVRFDGEELGPVQRVAGDVSALSWIVPAALWNRTAGRPAGTGLEFEFPDAASPAALDRTGRVRDTRLLGIGVSRVRFRATGPPGGL